MLRFGQSLSNSHSWDIMSLSNACHAFRTPMSLSKSHYWDTMPPMSLPLPLSLPPRYLLSFPAQPPSAITDPSAGSKRRTESGIDYSDSMTPQSLDLVEHEQEHDCLLDCIEKMKESLGTPNAESCNCKKTKLGEHFRTNFPVLMNRSLSLCFKI